MSEAARNDDLIQLAEAFVEGKFDKDTHANKLSVRQLRLRVSPAEWNQLVVQKGMREDFDGQAKEEPRMLREDEAMGGAVVTLASGGPGMTINRRLVNSEQIECLWFNGRKLRLGTFWRTSLLLVKPAPAD